MHTGHLFAGAGGGILADLINGHQPVWAVEWDAYACAVLRARFPGLHVVEGDVRGVDFRRLARVDAICGGFPCQDISVAGNGAGIAGERSGLYREIMRAVDAVRPDWVFLENSPAIRTKGRHIVIGDLVALGYSWRDGILAASDVGAPHQRNRWWCLARRSEVANADGIISGQGGGGHASQGARGRDADRGSERQDVADSSRDGLQDPIQGAGSGCPAGQALQASAGCDQRPSWWKAEPAVGRVADGLAAGAHGHWASRIKALGNGQVPICAAVAWRLLGGPVT